MEDVKRLLLPETRLRRKRGRRAMRERSQSDEVHRKCRERRGREAAALSKGDEEVVFRLLALQGDFALSSFQDSRSRPSPAPPLRLIRKTNMRTRSLH